MLRRYLIVNGIATVLIYFAGWSAAENIATWIGSAHASAEALVTESALLSPVLRRVITVW